MEVEASVSILIDPSDLVHRHILTRGTWEPGTWRIIDSHLPPGGAFVDVGAHIGYHSLKAAKKVGPSGRVLAIEPNPATVRQLRENVAASGAAQIVVWEVACSDHEGVVKLYAGGASNTGNSSLSPNNVGGWDRKGPPSFEVRARPLDAIVDEAGLTGVDVIKADVEGAEMLVLRGAVGVITRFRPVLIVETYDYSLRSMNGSESGLAEFLVALGYQ
jgi:FkbM family methyltransferase